MSSRVSIALFGFGRAGQIHFKNIYNNKRVHLRFIVEENTIVAEKFVKDYGLTGTQVCHSTELANVLNDESLQACIIATPTDSHEALVLACLDAGKGVFCEKPLANSVEAIADCYDKAKSLKLPLMCGFNRRFDPGLREIYDRVKAGEIGQVQMAKLTSRDYPLPPTEYLRNTKGIYHDTAIHNIDLVTWLFGEKPQTIFTTAHAFLPEIEAINDVDTVAICMKFSSGGIAMIDISRFARFGYDQRLEVFGNNGMLTQHNNRATNVELSNQDGTTMTPIYSSFAERFSMSYILAIEHFVDLVQGKCSPEITKESTVLVHEIIKACEQSLTTGQAVTLVSR